MWHQFPSFLPKEKSCLARLSSEFQDPKKKKAVVQHAYPFLAYSFGCSFTAVYNLIIRLISSERSYKYTGGIWMESHVINLSAPIQVQNTEEESVLQTF